MPTNQTSKDTVEERIEQYRDTARDIRKDILDMTYAAQSGHVGGSLSAVEFLLWLYNEELEITPETATAPDRDRLVYSKGHACPVLYAILAHYGFITCDPNEEFRTLGGELPGHSSPKVPAVEFPSGSLGQGLSYANGLAMSAAIGTQSYDVYVVLGDGETQEGNIWEAAMTAGNKNLNVTAIVDRNRKQNDLPVAETKEIEPLPAKFESFGWNVWECDGHSFESLSVAFDEMKSDESGGPNLLIANTVKGQGVPFMQEVPNGYHAGALSDEGYERALGDIGFDPETASEVTTR